MSYFQLENLLKEKFYNEDNGHWLIYSKDGQFDIGTYTEYLLIEQGFTEYHINITRVCDTPGYDSWFFSAAWIDDYKQLNMVTLLLERY